MLTRLVYLLRGVWLALPRWLSSWKLSVVLMLTAALYHLFLAIWAGTSPVAVVQRIAGLTPYWVVYALLMLNSGFCLWRRIPSLARDLSAPPLARRTKHSWELMVHVPDDDRAITAMLRHLGYRIRPLGDGGFWGQRRRWAALGTFLFHSALFLCAFGLLTTFTARAETKVRVAVGETFTGADAQYLSASRIGRELRFTVEQIEPEYWRDMMLFTRLEARLELPPDTRLTTRINRPLWIGWSTFLRLSGVGYAPRYELLDRRGRVLESAVSKLDVFPPGMRDHIQLSASPHRVYLEVLPDLAIEQGAAVNRSLNLNNPAVVAQVYRGSLALADGVLTEGKGLQFEGLTIHFPEIRYWGEFTIVRDPGAPLLFSGFLVAMIGLLLRVRGRRGEIILAPPDDNGRCSLRGFGDAPLPALGVGREGLT